MNQQLLAPYPYFGGKRSVAPMIWQRLGHPKQYIEPFCGSAAVLLAAPEPASLEVIGDMNGFVANFWRAVVHQSADVARWADYPVSHIDLGARHQWLMTQRPVLEAGLHDPDWPGDAKCAGWWLWGQCCWIGSGWCDWSRKDSDVSSAGMGIQASGRIPHVGNAGMGIQASGKIPQVSDVDPEFWTSSGEVAGRWLRKLAARLERVRVVHGEWSRCLNNNYGKTATAVFFDPPYVAFEGFYGAGEKAVAHSVADWCREHQSEMRIALCGHIGDYDLPGWDTVQWERPRATYSGTGTKDQEMIWFSPTCARAEAPRQASLFTEAK